MNEDVARQIKIWMELRAAGYSINAIAARTKEKPSRVRYYLDANYRESTGTRRRRMAVSVRATLRNVEVSILRREAFERAMSVDAFVAMLIREQMKIRNIEAPKPVRRRPGFPLIPNRDKGPSRKE